MKNCKRILRMAALSVLFMVLACPSWANPGPVTMREVQTSMKNLQIPFIANQGQWPDSVVFVGKGLEQTLFVTQDGQLVYSLRGEDKQGNIQGWTVVERFMDGAPSVSGGQKSGTNMSFFKGKDRRQWRRHVSTYQDINLGEVWPGISVKLRLKGNAAEKLVTVQPDASVDKVRMTVDGASDLRIAEDGRLVFNTGIGQAHFSRPVAWQEIDDREVPVGVAYRVDKDSYGFALGQVNPLHPVHIDPILQSSYLGGYAEDKAHAVAIHPSTGDAYVAGETRSADFPGTEGGAQESFGEWFDAFVVRLNADLTTLVQAT